MKILFKLDDLEKQLANIQTSIVELEAWYGHTKLCHVYFDSIKTKTQTRSNDFGKMCQYHEAFSLFYKHHKKLFTTTSTTKLVIQFDFDIFIKVAQNLKKTNDNTHVTCHIFDKYRNWLC
ncbi:unnamed protein product [Rotaria sp. Silwood1]|nr:unnamed protein product [Rotaria sp. Silwood1]